jgi:RHS repeat-associated protein
MRFEMWATRHLATYDNVPAQTIFIHDDWQGTERVRSLYNGTSYETCTNLPFGDSQSCTVAGRANDPSPLHYTGKMRDVETNLDYFGARYYSSGMAHWMSPDWADKPTSVPYANFGDPQSLNLYGFVINNPVSKQDSDGHMMSLAQEKESWDGSAGSQSELDGPVTPDSQLTTVITATHGDGTFSTTVDNGEFQPYTFSGQTGQQGQQSQWQTTPPETGHYLTNAYFPKGAGGFAHWGVGLDTPDQTVGFATNDGVPKFLRAILLALGVPLPGAIHKDSMVNQSGVQRFYRPLTDAQFDAAVSAINNRASNRGLYSLYFRNCALWDQSVDHAAGVSEVPHIVAFPMLLRLWYPQQ